MGAKSTVTKQKRRIGGVRDSAYEQFQAALLDGRLRPGQIVSQRDLVEMMGLSIGALREILPRLQAEGLILVLPQRGIQIPAIDLPLIRDAFQMRGALEREAVIHAVSHLDTAVLQEQHQLHTEIVEAVRRFPSEEALQRGQDIDDSFHKMLVQATGNELLINAYHINSMRIRLIKLDRIRLSERTLPAAFSDHLTVIEAILARDKQRAVDAIDAHIANARKRAVEI